MAVPTPLVRKLEAMPLQVRLIAIVMVLVIVALTLTNVATAYLMRRDLTDRIDSELRLAAAPVARQALDYWTNQSVRPIPTGYVVVFFPTNGLPAFTVTNPTGVEDQPAVPPLALSSPHVRKAQPFTIGSTNSNEQWRVIAGKLANNRATFVVGIPLSGVKHTVGRLLLFTTLLGAAVLAACAALGSYAVRRAFRPLAQIEDTAAAIADGDLARRIPTRVANDEVTSLSRSLNAMLSQIEQSFAVREASEERMRQFVADASHELRTPLATVRGYAELYRQGAVRDASEVAGAMARIESEATRMGGLVEDLLMLARLDDERPLERQPVDLTVLAADAAQDARAIDPERPITVRGLQGDLAPTVVTADEATLRQVLANLMANALRHTPAGMPVDVLVGTEGVGEQSSAVIQVRDHGPGIPPETARRVFERFYRADPSRGRGSGGNGLGLAIVAAIVAAQGGKVGVAETPGGGATFIVQLPTANSQSMPSKA
jgi:two-component system OmpR family sensor kinase